MTSSFPSQVFVVEDDEDARSLTAVLLEGAGLSVRAFACAEEALDALRDAPPQVVVTDIHLGRPDAMDGEALARAIRAESPPTRILAFSGAVRIDHALFDAVLVKPADPPRLLDTIRCLGAPPGPQLTSRASSTGPAQQAPDGTSPTPQPSPLLAVPSARGSSGASASSGTSGQDGHAGTSRHNGHAGASGHNGHAGASGYEDGVDVFDPPLGHPAPFEEAWPLSGLFPDSEVPPSSAELLPRSLLAQIAHDLRTPLTPLRIHGHQLRARLEAGEPLSAEHLALLERQIDRLVTIVDRLALVAGRSSRR